MKPPLLLTVAAGIALVVVAISATPSSNRQPPATPIASSAGHLILQIEGDANGLRIVRITKKVDPVGYQVEQQTSHRVVLLAADGIELGSVPLDLSHFDLDPAHVGRGPKVEGCIVRDTNVGILASVVDHPETARIEIRAGSRPVGGLGADAYRALIASSERR